MAFSAAAALSGGEGKSYSNQQLVVTGKPRQIGICQRSLTRRCRLGRATELVFITAMGAMITIGGQATAQNITYNDGETRTATLDTTGDIDLTVNAGEATQSGVISSVGIGDLYKKGAGTLTLSGENTYTGMTYVNEGTLGPKAAPPWAAPQAARLSPTGQRWNCRMGLPQASRSR
jgi:autotransporter-associated beta strand protein